ncbi:beta-ketoacyl-[acyl-carrier-protein] synthase family protein [Euzebya rosea]|uniref:beta-ketoacyl-[acyl-carrier-protein] synthase family protein n=1 Tax=Euzebya rosea TaxID=2052804 RepID=UPI000D3E9A99|nr:beta-ketoacyl-ACP synthase II [Euzebya rosea]
MSPAKVAITGLGAVSPHGVGVAALWDGLLVGRSCAAPITRYDASAHRVRFACEVPGDLSDRLPRRLLRQTDPFARYALVAAEEALADAGLLAPDAGAVRLPVEGIDADRVAVVIASGAGGMDELTSQHQRLIDGGPGRVRPYLSIAMPLNMAAGQVAMRHGLRGPASAVVSACASAADAIGSGLDLLRAGRADVAVVGGAEAAVNSLTMAGFDAAGAMSRRNDDPTTASRPFDVDRDGFVAGEGAAILVLETAEHAAARGVTPLAWLAGYGASNDALDPSSPAPDGEGAVRAMRIALADAGLEPGDIDHVNAHATSTPVGDLAEATAMATVFGEHRPVVTAPKSSFGHLMGAAGAIEAVATVQALRHGIVPATLNTLRQDPACMVDLVLGHPREGRLRAAMSSSFGFGGHNAVLVVTRAGHDPHDRDR